MLVRVQKSDPLTDNVHAIADRLSPLMRSRFLEAVATVQRRVDVEQLLGALAANDPHEAFVALGIDRLPAQLSQSVDVIRKKWHF